MILAEEEEDRRIFNEAIPLVEEQHIVSARKSHSSCT